MAIGSQRTGPADDLVLVEGEESIDLRQLLAMLWRRRFVVLGAMLIFTSFALLIVMQITPLYVAEAHLVVEPPRTNVVDIDAVAQNMATDYYTNETQAAIIGSRVLAEKVVDKLGLAMDPRFNPALGELARGPTERLNNWFDGLIPETWWTAIRDFRDEPAGDGIADAEPFTPEEYHAWLREVAIDTYLWQISVVPSDSSRVIAVGFTWEHADIAARIANAAAEAYIEDQVAGKSEQTERANAWLQDRAIQLKQRVEDSARALEEHRRKSGLVTVGGSTLLQQQLSELNSQLIAARAQRAEAEARYQQIQRLLESKDGINSAAAVLQSPLIQHLREQETEIVRKIAEMKTQYREGHPKMILARSELKDLVIKIGSEVMKIVANLGNELEIARVRENMIAREVNSLRSELDTQAGAEITLRALEVEFTANQKLYDTILARLKETGVQDSALMQADARIISYATIPAFPAHPRKKLIVAVAFVGSLMLGVLLALLIEHLDAGFRTREQLETVTGVAALGIAPRVGSGGLPGRGLHDEIVERPHSKFSEAVRTLRTALLLSDVDHPPCTIVVTSSIPGEGKTTTSLSLARTAAMHGQRCIIIDGDLRNASLHGLLGVKNRLGLIDYLSRDASVEDLVQVDLRSGAHYILAGETGPHPSDLLGSVKMRNLLNGLRQAYDLVIVDTPPVLTISDTLVLLRHVDKTMFLVRCEKTRRETALAGIRQAVDAGAQIAGLVLSQVDLKKHTQHYGEKGYYYGRYHRNEQSYSDA